MSDELQDAIQVVRGFVDGTGGKWDWDDILSLRYRDPEVVELQGYCRELSCLYPPEEETHYCNEEGMRQLRAVLANLEKEGRFIRPPGPAE